MKIGMTIEPFKGVNIKKVTSWMRLIQIDHLEINRRIIPFVDEFSNELGRTTTTFHLPIYDYDHFDLSSTEKKYESKIQETIQFINNHKEKLNLIYTLTHPPEGYNTDFELLMDRLTQIRTPILIENIKGQSDEDFMDFYFKAKDRLGKQLAGHAIDAPHRYVTDWKNWLNIPPELLKEIAYVHISDCNRKKDLHKPLGDASLPFNQFFQVLKKIDYQGIILQEIKPKASEPEKVLDSSLHCIRPFSKQKYLRMKFLYSFIRPFISWKIRSIFKRLEAKGQSCLAKDLALELV